eukprot:scaffold262925_cov16-Tisochrysis_lutea.AAC.3
MESVLTACSEVCIRLDCPHPSTIFRGATNSILCTMQKSELVRSMCASPKSIEAPRSWQWLMKVIKYGCACDDNDDGGGVIGVRACVR